MLNANPQKTCKLQRARVGVQNMAAGMQYPNRSCHTDPVQVMPGATLVAKVNRIKSPADYGRLAVRVHRSSLGQCGHHGIQRFGTGNHAVIGVHPVEIAHVHIAPQGARHQVRVPLNQTRDQHLVSKLGIKLVRAPASHISQIAYTQNASVPHRHVRGPRTRRIHRHNAFGLKNRDLFHGESLG